MNFAEAVVRLLQDEGVDRVFGNPGTTELPLLDAIADSGLPYVLGVHEGSVVAAADGYARATRRPAFVNLHVAAGVANGLIGMLNARRSRTPLVITAGQQDSRHLLQEPMLSGDLVGLASAATKWAVEVRRSDEVLTMLRRAFRAAVTPPAGPVFVSIPMDLLEESLGSAIPARTPVSHDRLPSDVAEFAQVLRDATSPVVVAGDGVGRAGAAAVDALVEIAERLGAPVFHQPMFDRIDFPSTHPNYLGMLPPENSAIQAALRDFDTVVLVGVRAFAPHHYSPDAALVPTQTVVQIDEDTDELGRNYPAASTLLGAIGPTLRLLAKELQGEPKDLTAAARARALARRAMVGTWLHGSDACPFDPTFAAAVFATSLPDSAIVIEEAITVGLLVREALQLQDVSAFHHTVGGGLGWGLGAAAGIAMGSPGRRVFAALGDGCALFGVHGLWIAARHRLPVTAVVFANGEYRTLKQTMTRMKAPAASEGRFVGLDLTEPAIQWPELSRSFGVESVRVSTATGLREAMASQTAADGPLLIEVPTRSFAEDAG